MIRQPIYSLLTRTGIALCAFAAGCTLTSSLFADPGDLYVTDLATGSVIIYTPDGTPSTFAAGLTSPQGIAFDQGKNLYVADAGDGAPDNGTIFKYNIITKDRTTFRSGLDNPIGLAVDGSDLLVAENGLNRVLRVPLDGIHPPTVFKIFTNPLGLTSRALDQSGFFRYIATGAEVWEVTPGGVVTDIDPGDGSRNTAVDGGGNVFVSTETGTISKIAAGSGAKSTFGAGFTLPTGMDFRPAKFGGDTDRVGFLYVADTTTGEISQISQGGTKSTFATGAGNPNFIIFEVNDPTPTPTPTPSPTPTVSPTPTPTPTPPAKAQNISTRVDVETGDNVAITGFIISGGSTPKQVIVRALGPSLGDAIPPVPGFLADPVLELHLPDGDVMTNDNWKDNSLTDQGVIVASGLAPSKDLESVIVATLPPAGPGWSGAYTAVVRGSGGGTGIGLAEAYDLGDPADAAEFANISTRGMVGTGDKVLIGGVIIGPAGDATVVVRALGPSLSNAVPPVSDVLTDPELGLYNGNGDLITMNDDWQDDPSSSEVEAQGLAPTVATESALLANLVADNYTAIVSGKNDTTGVALVEIYHPVLLARSPSH